MPGLPLGTTISAHILGFSRNAVAHNNKNVLSQLWRLKLAMEVLSELVPSEDPEEDLSHASPSLWWLLAILGLSQLADASLEPPLPSSPAFPSPCLIRQWS